MKAVFDDVLQSLQASGEPQDGSLLGPLAFDSFDGDRFELVVSVPSIFYKEQFVRRFQDRLADGIASRGFARPAIVCRVRTSGKPEQMPLPEMGRSDEEDEATEKQPPRAVRGSLQLNERYDFDSFITGPSNQFSYSYSKSVAEKPGASFNPLFIYGGSGLGKTHLLNAVALDIRKRYPRLRIIYQTAEEFTNQMISHIQRKKDAAFRDAYRRRCDVLLIDDIQFIAGKERTMEEFFHIFNSLYMRQKQIVLTSDTNPRDIPDFPDRLRTRFAVGLTADIQPPELETRIAILKAKADAEQFVLPEEVLYYIANVCSEHVRQLEGALMQLRAYSSLIRDEITVEMVKRVLKTTATDPQRPVTMDGIIKAVCGFYNVTIGDMKGPRRQKTISYPRQQAMYLARKLTDLSYPEIGKRFGGRDHTTVIHADRKIAAEQDKNPELKRTLTAIEEIARKKS